MSGITEHSAVVARTAAEHRDGRDVPRTTRPRRAVLLLLLVSALAAPAMAQRKVAADPRAALPARKAGLWEVTVQPHAPNGMGGMRQPPQTVRQCTSAKAERVMLLAILPGQENCGKFQVAKRAGQGGSGHDIAAACKVHDQRVLANVQLRGDLRSVYSGTYRVEYPGAPMGSSGPVDFQGRWLGACAAGQRPGDMVLPNGIKVNVVDDVGRAETHAH